MKNPPRQLQARINPNYVPMSKLGMDLKVMPRSHKGHKYILCIIDEVTNYLITVPIFQAKSEEIEEKEPKLETRKGGTIKGALQISVYLYILYGIVKVEIYSRNKR